jgi:carboxylate-amine ligase
MPVEFKGSPQPTLGVEIELQLVDPETRQLVPRSIQLLDACRARGYRHIKAEFTQSMIEIDTEIAEGVKACRVDLEQRLADVQRAASDAGVRVCVAGTHPFQRWTESRIYPSERYRYLLEKYQWLARRLTVFGMHVHVGVTSGERAIAISNAAIRYLPHLLALSASSPFWEGIDTGLQSCRVNLLESFPISGRPYYFPDWREFERYVDTLLQTEAIRSHKDLYWFVRPSPEYGTLEFRICDGIPTLTDTMALVALIQALVVWIDEGFSDGSRTKSISMRRYWMAPENQWVAARDGLAGRILVSEEGEKRGIGEDVLRLIDRLMPIARQLDSESELAHVATIVRHGTSAARQRAVHRETGRFGAVVDSLITELVTDQPTDI